MDFITEIKTKIQNILNILKGLFKTKNKNKLTIGFFGSPNVGKTSLANRICIDAGEDPIGNVSVIPHETREILRKEGVTINIGDAKLSMNILDLPGVSIKVDYREFLNYGLSIDEAQERAREATKGIVEALKVMEKVDAALVILDSTQDPRTQVNITLLGAMEAREIPFIIVANKIDLENSNVDRIKKMFPEYPIVAVSALTGKDMDKLYNKIKENIR
ncbi:50S ribosome-binding GTPase [Candidatus Micrarchaeota archaeon]|nr:50S ribosome-binding GTPase [Candidatus Micrarchaeota archaeon]